MAYLTAKSEEMKKFLIGKTIRDFQMEDDIEYLQFTDGTSLKFVPRVRITNQHTNGIQWKGEIVANPILIDGRTAWQ